MAEEAKAAPAGIAFVHVKGSKFAPLRLPPATQQQAPSWALQVAAAAGVVCDAGTLPHILVCRSASDCCVPQKLGAGTDGGTPAVQHGDSVHVTGVAAGRAVACCASLVGKAAAVASKLPSALPLRPRITAFPLEALASNNAAMSAEFLHWLMVRGYAKVQVPDDVVHTVAAAHAAANRLFMLEDVTAQLGTVFIQNPYVRCGYYERPDMGKRLLQRRGLRTPDAITWPDPGIDTDTWAAFESLSSIGRTCWAAACMHLFADPEAVASAAEVAVSAAGDGWCVEGLQPDTDGADWRQASLSVLDLFQYRPPPPATSGGLPSCDMHTDNGLMTIVVTAQGSAGLRVFDLLEERLVSLEDGAPANQAVVMLGEAAKRYSCGVLSATLHDVVLSDAASGAVRSSAPFLLFPHESAAVGPHALSTAFASAATAAEHRMPACPARRFIAEFAAPRPSVTFHNRSLELPPM